MSGTTMRGLTTFITDIRHCKSKDQETSRVEKELAKIRQKFTQDKGLSGYHRKKYVWKLLYIYILGYEIDFGHEIASFLINSPKFSEKYTGYVATGILVHESNEQIYKTVSQAINIDLTSNNEINSSLALSMIGALAPKELTIQVEKNVMAIAFSESKTNFTLFQRKKAILCLLRMLRKYPERYTLNQWVHPILHMFEGRYISLGYISSACSLVLGVFQSDPQIIPFFTDIVPKIVKILQKLVISKECSQDYMYYHTPNPWLQVKLLKILQNFHRPDDDQVAKLLFDILKRIIKKTEVTKSLNKNNADHGILFEATNLIINYSNQQDSIPENLHNDIVKLLGIFISVREPNLKYLGLETMCKFSKNNESILEQHLGTILKSLRMNDISIKRRALDLLYLMCTEKTSARIVEELLGYAEEWADLQIKEELVLKIAILAERFAENLIWYIDIVVRLVNSSGEYVTEDIWFRIIQIITGFGKDANAQLQKYAAQKFYNSLNMPHAHETLVMIGAFIVSEYSNHLVESGKEPQKIFDVLHRHFQFVNERGKCMLLNSYAKLAAKYEDVRDQAQMIFLQLAEHFDPDLQQRGVEYNALLQEDETIYNQIFQRQPCYSEEIQSNNPLLKRIYKLKLGNNKEAKDPTVQREIERGAKESYEQALTKSQVPIQQTTSQKPISSSAVEKHIQQLRNSPLFHIEKDKLVLDGVNISIPRTLSDDILNAPNLNEIKAVFPTKMGNIFTKQNELSVNYKCEFKDHMAQIAMQFESNIGKMENVSVMVSNPDQSNGLDFNIQPINEQGPNPVIVIQVMSIDPIQTLPKCILFYEISGQQKKFEFLLPIYVNKFISMVDIPEAQFYKFWDQYSDPTSKSFYKIDDFIQNPAPQVSVQDVLRKIGGLLTNVCGLKANGLPDMNSLTILQGAGQFMYKDQSKGQQTKLPVMIVVEANENQKEQIRISLRGAGSDGPILGLYQIIRLYMNV